MDLHHRVFHGQQDKGDERDAGDAVGLKTVGRRTHRIARVVARAIGDHAGVAGVVFLDFEDDLHQVAADIGDLGEDAAGHAEGRRAERLADSEADEAGARQVARDEQQDEEHDQQLDRDQQHPDAHAGLQRDVIAGIGLSGERGERGARVGEGIHAHAEGRHGEAAGDADHAEQQNDDHLVGVKSLQEAEVENNDHGNEGFQQHEELALRAEVGFTGFVDQLGNFPHGRMHRHVAQAEEDDEAEDQAESADHQAAQQQIMTVDAAQKRGRSEVGQVQVGFTAFLALGPHRGH